MQSLTPRARRHARILRSIATVAALVGAIAVAYGTILFHEDAVPASNASRTLDWQTKGATAKSADASVGSEVQRASPDDANRECRIDAGITTGCVFL